MTDVREDLLGRRCKLKEARGTEYIYLVAAVWLLAGTKLTLGLVADGGGTAIALFEDVQFEPRALKGV